MDINENYRQGIFFGINAGVITSSGLLAGLAQTTNNHLIIIISIISLAISDAVSEAYSLYLSKKAKDIEDKSKGPLYSALSLTLTKIIIVLSFLIPFIFSKSLKYYKNLIWPLFWSLFILIIIDYKVSKLRNESILKYIISHIFLLFFVIFTTKFFGNMLQNYIS